MGGRGVAGRGASYELRRKREEREERGTSDIVYLKRDRRGRYV